MYCKSKFQYIQSRPSIAIACNPIYYFDIMRKSLIQLNRYFVVSSKDTRLTSLLTGMSVKDYQKGQVKNPLFGVQAGGSANFQSLKARQRNNLLGFGGLSLGVGALFLPTLAVVPGLFTVWKAYQYSNLNKEYSKYINRLVLKDLNTLQIGLMSGESYTYPIKELTFKQLYAGDEGRTYEVTLPNNRKLHLPLSPYYRKSVSNPEVLEDLVSGNYDNLHGISITHHQEPAKQASTPSNTSSKKAEKHH